MKKCKLSKVLAIIFFVLLFAVVLTVSVGAKTTDVEAGTGTLAAAINAAEAGDILNLTGGTYNEAGLNVTKDLTIQGTGSVVSSTTIFNIKGDAVLTLGGSVAYSNTASVGFSVQSDNVTVNFKDSVSFSTKAQFFQDSAKVTANGLTKINVYGNQCNLVSNGHHALYFGNGSGKIEIYVEGGTITSATTSTFCFNANVGDVKVTILGGQFNANVENFYVLGARKGSFEAIISGGTFVAKSNSFNICSTSDVATTIAISGTDGSAPTFTPNGHVFNLKSLGGAANVTVSGGNYAPKNNVVMAESCKKDISVKVEGGTFTPTTHFAYYKTCAANCATEIKGGTFTPGNCFIVTNATPATVTMTGGNVTSCNIAFNLNNVTENLATGSTKNAAIVISGSSAINASKLFASYGNYTADITLNCGGGLLQAPTVKDDANEKIDLTVNGASYVNGSKTVYTSFGTALNNVAADGTVTVYGNSTGSVEIKKGVTINGSGTVTAEYTVFNVRAAAANATINFAGSVKYVSQKGVGFSVQGSGITINFNGNDVFETSGNVMQDSASLAAGSTLTVNVNGGTFKSLNDNCFRFGISDSSAHALEIATLTVTGGTFEAKNAFVVVSGAAAVITVNGGDVTKCTNGFNVYGKVDGTPVVDGTNHVTATVSAVTMTATSFIFSETGGMKAKFVANGGTLAAAALMNTEDVVDYTIAEAVVLNCDRMINGASFVNANGETIYSSVNYAVLNVPENGTVTVMGNSTMNDAIRPNRNMTIVGSGRVTSPSTIFNVAGGVTLTLGGEVTYVTANNNVGFSINGDNVTVNFKDSVAFETKGRLLQDSAKVTASGITTLNFLGGTFTSNTHGFYFDLGTGKAVINVQGGTFNASGHNFYFGSKAGSVTLTVSGGNFAKANASTFCFNGFLADVSAKISGGTWTPNVDCLFFNDRCNGKFNVEVTGGTFAPKQHVFNIGAWLGVANVELKDGTFNPGKSTVRANGTIGSVTINAAGGKYTGENIFHYDGYTGTGLLNVTGGEYAPTSGSFIRTREAVLTINVSGGTVRSAERGITLTNNAPFNVKDTNVCNVVNISGTALIEAKHFVISTEDTVNAQLNIMGGTLRTTNTEDNNTLVIYRNGSGTTYLNMTGGVMENLNYPGTDRDYISGIFQNGGVLIANLYGGTITARVPFRQKVGVATVNVHGTTLKVLKNGSGMLFASTEGQSRLNLKSGLITYADPAERNVSGLNLRDNVGIIITIEDAMSIVVGANCISVGGNCALNGAKININGGYFKAETGYCVNLVGYANDTPTACNIFGGTFVTEKGHAAVLVSGNDNGANTFKAPRANIYGGYFEGSRSACLQAVSGGVINVWGGYFHYTGVNNGHGSPVLSGTGSGTSASKGTVNVYGGNFVSEGSGAALRAVNNLSVLNLYGGVNAVGGGSLVSNSNTATGGTPSQGYAPGKEYYAGSIFMTDGAGVRIARDSNGLRFVSVVTGEALAYLNSVADSGSISYGTLIAPVDLVQKADSFTHDGMLRAGVLFVDVPAKDGLVARAEGGYYVRAAIVNIRDENIDREFAAVSYVRYTVNGKEVIVYSGYREHKNARSIAQVARLAMKEAELYTAEQLAVLATYAPTTEAPVIDFYLLAGQSNAAGSTNFQQDFANSDPDFKNGYSNVYYSGFSMSGSGISTKLVNSCVPVKIGYGNALTNFGPELGLADALSTYYNAESGRYAAVIKYAYSGICLRDDLAAPADAEGNWCPPSWLEANGALDPVLSGQHYRSFVQYIEACIADYEAMGFEVNIVAAYWMQGEQDVSWNGTAGLYDELLTCLVNDLRADVAAITGDEKYLQLPFMIGELSAYLSELSNNPTHFANTAALIQAQHDVAAALTNVYVMEQSNLPSFDIEPGEKASNKDRYHWISHNMLWIGQQLGYTVLEEILGVEVQLPAEEIVAEVYLGDELIGSYTSLVGAISQAPEGATVKLTKDVTMYSTLVIGNTNAITLDGCGHSLTFIVPTMVNTGSSEANENCGAFRLYATDLTVKDLDVSLNVSVAGVYRLFGAEVEFVDCTFAQCGETVEAFAEVVVACTFEVN